ncbi:MAG: Na+/H+ antiporter NhaC family protein [Bacillota bacterium]
MFLAEGNPVQAMGELYTVMAEKIGANTSIIVFLIMLGIMVVLMSKSGGSLAYGNWASKKIKTREGAMLATAGLGALIFVDDYFNCLTVGNVMRPVTDKFNISRSKLAYIIDSTAAPICIIAPISSWAAAVSGELDGDGLVIFIQTIPLNLYALLSICMVIFFCVSKFDLFKMRKNEQIAIKTGDLHAGETDLPMEDTELASDNKNGKVAYLLIPIIVLIISCICGMIYTGYYYNWDTGLVGTELQSSNLIESFSNCEAGLSLAIGSTFAVIFTIIYYMATKALNFKAITESFTQGFKSMVPAILILSFAWTLSGIMGAKGGGLEASTYVQNTISADSIGALGLLPAILFLCAAGISFATGTSWGTFGILIPIATAVLGTGADPLTLLSVSAVLAGSVFGDHISPISDTTILSSSGAQCNHVDHVKTQLPYAGIVAIISFIGYLIMGFIANAGASYGLTVGLTLLIGGILIAGTLTGLYFYSKKLSAKEEAAVVVDNKAE